MNAGRRPAYLASAVTVALGLFFIFVRAPHPFGWEGIDHYHDLGLILARGEPFPTTDVPWGYAYFLAFFYRLAGPRMWIPLVVQALLNGLVPVLLYALVARPLGHRVAVIAAVLAGLFSFNTIYASMESSDAVCTVLFLASLLAFARGQATSRLAWFVAAGVLAGLAPQFRPNLILFAPVLGVVMFLVQPAGHSHPAGIATYVAIAAVASVPWTIRNYQVTGQVIPTSTHGGVQLWYGSLQTGPYLTSRAHNPRKAFELAAFDYTSLTRPISVTAVCGPDDPARLDLVYWTDRHPAPVMLAATAGTRFDIPAQPMRTAVHYYFAFPGSDGQASPFTVFVDDRHLADLDAHDDVLNGFDLVTAVRGAAWGDGKSAERDVRRIAAALNPRGDQTIFAPDIITSIAVSPVEATLTFTDGSTLVVPRAWRDRLTDVVPTGELASEMVVQHRRMTTALRPAPDGPPRRTECRPLVNDAFSQREPHAMRRYTALALDNIARDPVAFAAASAYRAVRLFIVEGTSDRATTQQFAGSGWIYGLATLASASYVLLAAAGLVLAVRQRREVALLLTPILYVPLTICFVLTNMRYTVTVQPLLFAFAAVALASLLSSDKTV